MGEARSRRVFFALWPDDEAVGRLSALAHKQAAGGGRLTRPASLHMTLVFVGPVTLTGVGQLEGIAAGVRVDAFDLSIDCMGFWPQHGIMWAGCRQPPATLGRLGELLVADLRAAGFAIDHHPGSALVPHITLARSARCKSLQQPEMTIRWRISEFALVETRLHPSAASYKTLASFPLEEADAG